MATIDDVFIIDPGTTEAIAVEHGYEQAICGEDICGSRTLTIFRRNVSDRSQVNIDAGEKFHLLYVLNSPDECTLSYKNEMHTIVEGSGALLVPGEIAVFTTKGSELELLHMIVPKPPASVEEGLPGGPGYFFSRKTLRRLSDASGGRVRRFCAESTVRRKDGSRLTPTNAIQAGEMTYLDGGSSPYHQHVGTEANPEGASHCYIMFKGRGMVEVGETSRELGPGTLVYFPPGVPHRLRAHGGPLDYFEVQAWKSFKTNVLSEEPLGLKWYYDPETPDGERVEWDQS